MKVLVGVLGSLFLTILFGNVLTMMGIGVDAAAIMCVILLPLFASGITAFMYEV